MGHSMVLKEVSMYEEKPVDNVDSLDIKQGTAKAEQSLVRKMDLRLMPLFSMMYFFSYLDRSNMSNAKVAGMMEDLNLSQTQFSAISSVLYATYICAQIPGVLLMRRFKANYYLGAMMTCWSLVTIFTVFVNSYSAMIGMRLLIGLFEGSFFSCMAVYTTNCYQPDELGQRFGYLFVSSAISSSFGGLIATGITKISGGALANWRYLFLIEGLLTFVASMLVMFLLPADVSTIFTSEEEQAIFEERRKRRLLFMGDAEFNKNHVFDAYKSLKTYLSVVIQFCQDICLYGFTTFLPSILQLGLGFDSLQSQYLTIPVYLLAGAIFLTVAIISDKKKVRGPIMFSTNIVTIVGYIIILTVGSDGVKYFGCYLITASLYTNVGLNESWISRNSAPSVKRATSLATNQALGNVAGIISPQVYRAAPYRLGHLFTIGCLVVANLTIALQCFVYNRTNAKRAEKLRDNINGEVDCELKGDQSVSFRFMV